MNLYLHQIVYTIILFCAAALFLLAFQDMRGPEAAKKAEEIRETIKKIQIEQNLARVSTTVSIGVAEYPKNGITIKELMSAADQALYEGKENGRDRVVTATSQPHKGNSPG